MKDESKIWLIGSGCSIGIYFTVAAISEKEAREVFRTEVWEANRYVRRDKYEYCKDYLSCEKGESGDCPSCPNLNIDEQGRFMSHENC